MYEKILLQFNAERSIYKKVSESSSSKEKEASNFILNDTSNADKDFSE